MKFKKGQIWIDKVDSSRRWEVVSCTKNRISVRWVSPNQGLRWEGKIDTDWEGKIDTDWENYCLDHYYLDKRSILKQILNATTEI